jgi:hypothetical protein
MLAPSSEEFDLGLTMPDQGSNPEVRRLSRGESGLYLSGLLGYECDYHKHDQRH